MNLITITLEILNKSFDFITNKHLKNLRQSTEFMSLFENNQNSFKAHFFEQNNQEEFFKLKTGISTTYNLIPKYQNLKNKLGDKYSWRDIASANEYLFLNNIDFEIKLTKSNIRWQKAISIAFGVLSFISLFSLLYIAMNYTFVFSQKNFAILFPIFAPMISGFILLYFANPIYKARVIKNRLNVLSSH